MRNPKGEGEALGCPRSYPVHSSVDPTILHRLRTQYWNPIKHATDRATRLRNGEQALSEDSAAENEIGLSAGRFALSQTDTLLPLQAQLLLHWSITKISLPDTNPGVSDECFGGIHRLSSVDQTRQFRLAMPHLNEGQNRVFEVCSLTG